MCCSFLPQIGLESKCEGSVCKHLADPYQNFDVFLLRSWQYDVDCECGNDPWQNLQPWTLEVLEKSAQSCKELHIVASCILIIPSQLSKAWENWVRAQLVWQSSLRPHELRSDWDDAKVHNAAFGSLRSNVRSDQKHHANHDAKL